MCVHVLAIFLYACLNTPLIDSLSKVQERNVAASSSSDEDQGSPFLTTTPVFALIIASSFPVSYPVRNAHVFDIRRKPTTPLFCFPQSRDL